MKRILLIFIMAIISLSVKISSQNLYFKHLGINDGLSQVCITSLYQDEFGVMWIGTSEGVNRYNGISMSKFQENNALLNRNVTKISGNKNGFIYVISGSSLISISLKAGKTVCLREKGVNDIFAERDTLWSVCNDGIFYYTEKDNKLEFFTRRSPKMYQFSRIYIKGNFLYASTPTSVFKIDKNNPEKHEKIADISSNITYSYVDKLDNVWLGTWNGVYKITPDRKITNFNTVTVNGGISHNQIRCIIEDNYDNIWFGTFMGLDCYNYATDEWRHYIQYGNSPNTLSHTSVLSLLNDNNGNIWAGTYYGGINIFNSNPQIGYFFHSQPLREDWLNFHVIGNITKDNRNNIWICTEGGGLNIYIPNEGVFKHIMNQNDSNTPNSNNIKSIYYDSKNDRIYAGTHLGGLYVYDCKSNKGFTIRKSNKDNALPHDIVNEILPYKEGLVLLTQGGIVYMDTKLNHFYELPLEDNARKILKQRFAYNTIFIDSRNRLWLGHSKSGVTCVNLNTSESEYYKLDSVMNCEVSNIYEDFRGEIYICTLGGGLFHYINHKNIFESYNLVNNKFPSNFCYFIFSTPESKKLYVLHSNGLTLFNPISNKPIITTKIFNQTYNPESSIFSDNSGKLYIGGTNGLAVINESIFTGHNFKRQILPDRLFIYNKEVLPGDSTGILKDVLQKTRQIELNYKMNNLTLEYSTFDYLNNIHYPFEYSLEGFDNSWNITDGNRITYTNLPPGKYTLKARNIISGEKGDAALSSIDIVITPPFYASNIACFLYILAALVITLLIIRAIIKQTALRTSLIYERNEKNRIKELNKMKIDFFTNISHELRTPLTLILVQLEGLIHYGSTNPSIVNKLQKVYKNAQNLLNLSSELTDFGKQSEGKIKVEELDIVGYTKQIYSSFGELAKKRKINCHFSSSSNLINIWFDPKQMYKVLSNLIDNAIKYSLQGGGSDVYADIRRTKSEVQISITDTGVGIPSDKLDKIFSTVEEAEQNDSLNGYDNIGLSIVKKIVEMHHGNISVESIPDKGTSIIISLLTGNHHFSSDELKHSEEGSIITGIEYGINENMIINETEEETESLDCDANDEVCKPEILLVEDNEELCQILKDVLQPTYTLHISHNGTEGFDIANSIHPDMVICDLHLPGMSGKDLCYKIKNNVELSDISVIITANVSTTESMVETLLMGADDYIAKPFDVRLLYARIRSILKNKKRLVAWCGNNVNAVTTEADAISESDRKFLKRCIEIIRNNFENPNFDVTSLSNELCVGRSTLYTKFKQIAGIPPNEFIAKIKLEEAMNMLKEKPELNISEISVRLGFSSPRYFSRMFKNFFGVTPQSVRK